MLYNTAFMFKVSLATYAIRLKSPGSQKNESLSKFGPDDMDLRDTLRDCLQSLKGEHNAKARHVMSARSVSMGKDDRTLCGLLDSGVYGRGSQLYHIDRKKITHQKTAKEAEMLPFYFLFSIPEMADEGILILERAGNIGVRKLIYSSIRDYIKEKHPGYALSLSHLVREDVVNTYLNGGNVSAIRFVRFGISSDFSELMAQGGHEEQSGTLEMVAKLGRGKYFRVGNLLDKFFAGRLELNRFVELPDFPYNTVKLDVSKGGETKIIDLSQLKIRGFYDISEVVQRDKHGNPKFESIDEEARKLLDSIEEGVYAPKRSG